MSIRNIFNCPGARTVIGYVVVILLVGGVFASRIASAHSPGLVSLLGY